MRVKENMSVVVFDTRRITREVCSESKAHVAGSQLASNMSEWRGYAGWGGNGL